MPNKGYFSSTIVRQASALAFVALLLAGGLYYFLRDEAMPVQQVKNEDSQPTNSTSLKVSGSSIVEEQDGKRIWELAADSIEAEGQNKKMRLAKVKGTFYQDDENNSKIGLVAEDALLDTATKNIELAGQVQITNNSGASLTSPKANWDSKTRQFKAEGGIVFQKEDVVITGDSLEANADLGKVIVKGKAHIVKGGSTGARE